MSTSSAIAQLRRDLDQVKRSRRSIEVVDPSRYDWFADSCPCGVAPGQCREHPRARPSQRFPEGDHRIELALAGRGYGKTRVGAELVIDRIRKGEWKRVALVAATAADVRDTMIEGESGILAISRPDFMPKYEPSKRRLTWPNGAQATSYTAEKPRQLRGPNFDGAWADEVSSWDYPEAWDMLSFATRLGNNPRRIVTTTPKANRLTKAIIADPATVKIGGSTYENAMHLAPQFIEDIRAKYEGSRLGRQELYAEVLNISEAAWFGPIFDPNRHVTLAAEFDPRFPARLAIDAGVSRHTAAVLFQVREVDQYRSRVNVFGEFYSVDAISSDNAMAIHSVMLERCGEIERARCDPAATAQTGIGVAAFVEYHKVFGRAFECWPMHRVVDGLEMVELLLGPKNRDADLIIHPRCRGLIGAFDGYERQERNGEFLDVPKDPNHPHEDFMDALRGGVRDAFPDGFINPNKFRYVNVSSFLS